MDPSFSRPNGIPYPAAWKDRIRNYFIGFTELSLDTEPISAHFSGFLGEQEMASIEAQILSEIDSPFFAFDDIVVINLDSNTDRWNQMQKRLECLGIAERVRRISAVETTDSHHIGCALSHRKAVASAERYGYQSILVFEDDAIFLEDAIENLRPNVAELLLRPWKVFHLGGHRWDTEFPKAEGCSTLEGPCPELTTSHAVAYHRRFFATLLRELPATRKGMKDWIKHEHAIDMYLRHANERYVCSPSISSQTALLPQERKADRTRFTLGDVSPRHQGGEDKAHVAGPNSHVGKPGEHTGAELSGNSRYRLRKGLKIEVSGKEVFVPLDPRATPGEIERHCCSGPAAYGVGARHGRSLRPPAGGLSRVKDSHGQ